MECVVCFEKAANAQTNDILWCCGKYIHLRCLNDVRRLVRDECPHCRTASPSLRSEPTPLPNFLRGSDDTAVNKLIETGCHVIYITLPDESLNHLLFLNDDDARAPPPLRTSVSFENSLRVPWEVISAAPLAVELPPEDPWGGCASRLDRWGSRNASRCYLGKPTSRDLKPSYVLRYLPWLL